MKYVELNEFNKKKMRGIINPLEHMDWENPELLQVLLGKLPEVKAYGDEKEIYAEVACLRNICKDYDWFKTDKEEFIKKVNEIINQIKEKQTYWNGYSIYYLQECLNKQKYCLINGDGGIGKTYFVKCFEEELEVRKIKHLCIYGKFTKSLVDFDFEEIKEIARLERFVIIIDALNEIDVASQKYLAKIFEELKALKGLQVVVTYRNYNVSLDVLALYEKIFDSRQHFTGVSFESALERLLKLSVPNVYKFENLLYTNNPALLGMLSQCLDDIKVTNEELNSLNSVTYILEYFIKKRLGKDKWLDTKEITSWMYHNNVKHITVEAASGLVKNADEYLFKMKEFGFISIDDSGTIRFALETLVDFLLVRNLMNELKDKTQLEIVEIINNKRKELYGIDEAIIMVLFDVYASNYKFLKFILMETELIDVLKLETLTKINFTNEQILEFLKVFKPKHSHELLLYFGGYRQKPFNCVNYLNKYYLNNGGNQLGILSRVLSGNYIEGNVGGRLKNIIYYLTMNNVIDEDLEEQFYFAVWCSASPNQDVRSLSMKLLFEIIRIDRNYIERSIDIYNKIYDYYIKEALVIVLSSVKIDEGIELFFRSLKEDENFLLGKSIKNMADVLGEKYEYIKWSKKNLIKCSEKRVDIKEFENVLFIIDAYGKELLPFRFWSNSHIDMYTNFINVNKNLILTLNEKLREDFKCINTKGECCGWGGFETIIKRNYGVDFSSYTVDKLLIVETYVKIFVSICEVYGFKFEEHKNENYFRNFSNSLLRKYVCIAKDILCGSLMCNYFTSEFATFNSNQKCLGYEVYSPYEYVEDINIFAPIPVFNNKLEMLKDAIVERLGEDTKKDVFWVNDLDGLKKRLKMLIEPINIRNQNWYMVAGRISLQGEANGGLEWKEHLNLWCCTNREVIIYGDENDRYKTIELESYNKNIESYYLNDRTGYFCKKIDSFKYEANIFDDTSLVLPPSEIIKCLNVKLCLKDMSWVNESQEVLIYCDNSKNSYFKDPIGGAVFIREDAFNIIQEKEFIKYFAFTERYIPETGYSDKTSMHFEICDGTILKEYSNYNPPNLRKNINKECENCSHGIYQEMNVVRQRDFQIIWDEEYGG